MPCGYRIPLANVLGHAMLRYRHEWMAAAQDALKGGSPEEVLRALVLPKDAAAVAQITARGMEATESNRNLYYVNAAWAGDELARRLRAGMRISSHGLAAEERAGEAPPPAAAAALAAAAAPAAGAAAGGAGAGPGAAAAAAAAAIDIDMCSGDADLGAWAVKHV